MIIDRNFDKPILEKIWEVTDFYDVPRCGVADFLGKKCYFEFIWDEIEDDYGRYSKLTPIPDNICASIARVNLIWSMALERWEEVGGIDASKIEIPIELIAEYEDLKTAIKQWIESERLDEFYSIANFRKAEKLPTSPDCSVRDNSFVSQMKRDVGVFWDI